MKFAGGAIFALMLISSHALAQPRDVAKADALFKEGRAAMKAGDLQTACPKLEESYRLDPTAGTAVNLGDCFDKQGKVGSALLAYRAARKLLKPGDPRIGPVEQQTADLEKRAPRLTITLAPDAPEGITVTRDGRAVDFSDFAKAVPMNPGEVAVAVSAPGRVDRRFTVLLGQGARRELVVDAGPPLVRDNPPTEASPAVGRRDGSTTAPAEDGGTQRTIGFVVGGAGLVALGVGGVFWLRARSKDDDATDAGCTDTKCPPGYAQDLSDDADTARSSANLSAGLGVLALAGGVVLVLTSPSGEPRAARLGIGPRVLVGGAGAQIGGRW